MFFKCEMMPVYEKAMRFRECVNVYPKTRGKALGIAFLKIDKTELATTGTAPLALKGSHKRTEGGRRTDGEKQNKDLAPSTLLHPVFEALF